MGLIPSICLLLRAFLSPRLSLAAEIGSIRRECLDHVIVLSERHLLRLLRSYFEYYHTSRTHMALDDNAPIPRQVELPAKGAVIAIPQLGGLHHRYTRRAA